MNSVVVLIRYGESSNEINTQQKSVTEGSPVPEENVAIQKRLDRRLVRAVDLASEVATTQGKQNYFERLEPELASAARKGEYEGVALYVVCETAEEIQKAREYCRRNGSERIVVAVPNGPVRLLDALMEVRALNELERTADERHFSMQDKAALYARLQGEAGRPGAWARLEAVRAQILSHKDLTWYRAYQAPLEVDPQKPYDAANLVMERLYEDGRNKVAHDDYNKLRPRGDRNRDSALKEAVEKLLAYTEPLIVDTQFPQQRGDRKYLEKCLLQTGALRQERQEGSRLRCEVESDEAKYERKLPALAAMVRDVTQLGDGRLAIGEWLALYRQAPYGQGPIALTLALAYVQRRFGDSIRVKAEDAAIGDLLLNSYDTVAALVEGKYPQASLSYRPLRSDEKRLAALVWVQFSTGASAEAAQREHTLREAHEALRAWWEGLPPLARVARLQANDATAARFVQTMERIGGYDPAGFLFGELPTVFGLEAGLVLSDAALEDVRTGLAEVKTAVEGAPAQVEERIFRGVCELFGVQANTYIDLGEAIRAWYNGLDSYQRDLHARWHTPASQPLLMYFKDTTDLRSVLFEDIPGSSDYGVRKLRDWTNDRVAEYLDRLRSGKALIEEHQVRVEPPELKLEGQCEHEGDEVRFHGAVMLTLQPKAKGHCVWVIEGEGDPRDPSRAPKEVNGEALRIQDSRTISYAVRDEQGNWGRTETLRFVDESQKFLVKLQPSIGKDVRAWFTLPQNGESLAVTCRSLFNAVLQQGNVSEEELEERVRAVLKELRKPARR